MGVTITYPKNANPIANISRQKAVTQADIALVIGVSVTMVNYYSKGRYIIPFVKAKKLYKHYKVDIYPYSLEALDG